MPTGWADGQSDRIEGSWLRRAGHGLGASPWPQRLGLLLLCAAYLQGGIDKVLDWPGALAEQAHFGLAPAPLFAAAAIVTELAGSALVLSGRLRWIGAIWLGGFTVLASCLANRFWVLPPGGERIATANAFFEHLGLAGGFLLVAIADLRSS